ncbi:hypothetical protein VitviT2T_030114 [Vitis vinifera]|uniref:25S rRNA (uridine-N(3))-methyltransferase BMT5-like domain-containing protein n=2 Tax=Vitis vinifera TaxID=29760 RepID=A0ABY9DYC1_VITVI
MAVGEEMVKDEVGVEEQEKRLMHYSSFHQILLVGEGDFSFSLCLAHSFASASNIVASSLDPYDVLIKMYKKAKSNLEALEKLGASLLFGVDATKMKLHTDLKMWKFDRIIYNFPHAGFHGKEDNRLMINMHRDLVHGFFRNASGMLRANGEIHVNHKTTAPFSHWNLEELASQNSLVLFECVDFKKEDYPGYNNKRGAGSRCDEPFRLGACGTFKFRFSPIAMKMSRIVCHSDLNHRGSQQINLMQMQQWPGSSDYRGPGRNILANMNGIPRHMGLPLTIFDGYFNHAVETFGRNGYDVGYTVHEAFRLGFERYMAEGPGRTLTGYINLLQELQHLSRLRSAFLQRMLLGPDHYL